MKLVYVCTINLFCQRQCYSLHNQTTVLTHCTLDDTAVQSVHMKKGGCKLESASAAWEGKTTKEKRGVVASNCPGALPMGLCSSPSIISFQLDETMRKSLDDLTIRNRKRYILRFQYSYRYELYADCMTFGSTSHCKFIILRLLTNASYV